MLAESQTDEYFERMKNSLGDKQKLLKFVKPGHVLDVGAGGGDLAEAVRLTGSTVTALDGSFQAIEHMNEEYPHLKTVQAYTSEMSELFEPETFDTIICSSILHEVYSYSEKSDKMDELNEALEIFNKFLKPGGRLLIRDGVKPNSWETEAFIKFIDKDGLKYLAMYSDESPFYDYDKSAIKIDVNSEINSQETNKVHFERISKNAVQGNLSSIMEFLYTYTWGWKAAPRETREFYGIMTEFEYRTKLESFGFIVQGSKQYLQKGYREHLKPLVDIFDSSGNEITYPSSNMIIVAEKE